MTDNNPEEERGWDPPGSEERTGHTEDPDGNFGEDPVEPDEDAPDEDG